MSKKFPQLILVFVAISYSGAAFGMQKPLPPRGVKLPKGITFKKVNECHQWCNKNNNMDGAKANACVDIACK